MRGVASGGGRFGSGVHDGELAERPAVLRRTRVAWRLWRASGMRVRMGRCQGASQVALEGSPGPLGPGCAVDEVHRWLMAGGGRNRASREERDGDKGISTIFEILGTCR